MKYSATVTVNESRWLTGEVLSAVHKATKRHELMSSLYDTKSKLQCCLGFGCRVAGMRTTDIDDAGLPTDAKSRVSDGPYGSEGKLPAGYSLRLLTSLQRIENSASSINDAHATDRQVRKRKLKKLFAKEGIRLRFIGSQDKAIAAALKAYRE